MKNGAGVAGPYAGATAGVYQFDRQVLADGSGRTALLFCEERDGGGVLLDLGSHHIDLVRWFLGREVEEVRASCRSQRLEDDTAMVELRLAGGLMVQSFFSQNAGDQDEFELYREGGKVTMERYRSWRGGRYLVRKLLSPDREPSYRAAWAHFVEAVESGREASPNLEDGYRSLEVIAAAEESARTGATVSLH